VILRGKAKVDKKPLIGVSICAVVLLVLGSLSNVVGYQIDKTTQKNLLKEENNTSTLTQTEELKIVYIWLYEDFRDWQTHLSIGIQNNGTKTIHFIHADGEWNTVFRNYNDIYHDDYENDITLEPQEIYNFKIFNLPMGGPLQIIPFFVRIAVHISVDNPDYNIIDIEGKYQYSFADSTISPMSGIWLWLANLLGRKINFHK